jgi:hypothetical protein
MNVFKNPMVAFFQRPQVAAVLISSPFVVFTLILLAGSPVVVEYMVFFNISYAAVLGTYVSATLWGRRLAEWQASAPAHDEEVVEAQLFSYIAPVVGWLSVVIPYPVLGLLLMIGVHGWFLSVYLRLKQENKLPTFVAAVKVHPFMISVVCLALNFVKAFFTCSA